MTEHETQRLTERMTEPSTEPPIEIEAMRSSHTILQRVRRGNDPRASVWRATFRSSAALVASLSCLASLGVMTADVGGELRVTFPTRLLTQVVELAWQGALRGGLS